MTTLPITDWADRWLRGFCAVGVLGGLPVRGPDYAAHPPLDGLLTLSPVYDPAPVDLRTVQEAWSEALGGAPVVLVASVERARALLLRALGVQPGEPVGLPANATRELAEAVKRHPHAVLGITKAADYLGVRWATDPTRAAWYAELMTEWYGADHDAFRPLDELGPRVTGTPLRR